MTVFTTVLPVPPTANNLFPTSRSGHRFPSKQYKAWRERADEVFEANNPSPPKMQGKFRAIYEFTFNDRRRRDLANFEKAVTDFLVSKGVIPDDCDIDRMELVRAPLGKTAHVAVRIELDYAVKQGGGV
jgi:crossover junction endodeoxyribonuclease RusA